MRDVMTKVIDMVGRRFGALVVIERGANTKGGEVRWRCACDCGGEALSLGMNLRSGHAVTCGGNSHRAGANKTHGESRAVKGGPTAEYISWNRIKDRCLCPTYHSYSSYGGRGITICDEWKDNYEAFLSYIGRRPSPDHSIDRIDNEGNYEPGNVRWATRIEQANNTRRTKRYLYAGRLLTLAEIARERGVTYNRLHLRITRLNWTLERALYE